MNFSRPVAVTACLDRARNHVVYGETARREYCPNVFAQANAVMISIIVLQYLPQYPRV